MTNDELDDLDDDDFQSLTGEPRERSPQRDRDSDGWRPTFCPICGWCCTCVDETSSGAPRPVERFKINILDDAAMIRGWSGLLVALAGIWFLWDVPWTSPVAIGLFLLICLLVREY